MLACLHVVSKGLSLSQAALVHRTLSVWTPLAVQHQARPRRCKFGVCLGPRRALNKGSSLCCYWGLPRLVDLPVCPLVLRRSPFSLPLCFDPLDVIVFGFALAGDMEKGNFVVNSLLVGNSLGLDAPDNETNSRLPVFFGVLWKTFQFYNRLSCRRAQNRV